MELQGATLLEDLRFLLAVVRGQQTATVKQIAQTVYRIVGAIIDMLPESGPQTMTFVTTEAAWAELELDTAVLSLEAGKPLGDRARPLLQALVRFLLEQILKGGLQ